MYHKWASLLMLCALAVALAACGNSKSSSGSNASEQTAEVEVVIKATTWSFDKPEYILPKDKPVKIILENEKGAHGIEVKGTDIDLGPGRESTVVTLKAGTYEFRCSIMCGSGHSDMVSKLIVQ